MRRPRWRLTGNGAGASTAEARAAPACSTSPARPARAVAHAGVDDAVDRAVSVFGDLLGPIGTTR